MRDVHSQLRGTLVSLYRRFAGDGEEVQHEWLAHLQRADEQLLDALTTCVRRSLHEVARLLQGDGKAEAAPVFVLSVVLDTNGRQAQVEPFPVCWPTAGTVPGQHASVPQWTAGQQCWVGRQPMAGWSLNPRCSSCLTRCKARASRRLQPWSRCLA